MSPTTHTPDTPDTPSGRRPPSMLRRPAGRRPVPTRTRLRTRRIPLLAYIAILLVLPVAVLVTARAAGWWVTSGHVLPATALGAPDAGGGSGEGSGEGSGDGGANATIGSPHDIKGSMTVQQVLDAFPAVTAADVYQQFGVAADTPASTQLKQLARDGNGYEVSDLREWIETQT
ncbi:MAG: hypothetical protein HKP61_15840 [Dactylosporangium sp.]|nr:hypothetical protein [Dactylosporangium sp.]NNJ62377.1 hypothetical protein [Dactylosporangium sp.]